MATHSTPRQIAEYAALRSLCTLLMTFPVQQNLRTASGIGSLFYRLHAGRRRRAEQNIALSFPELGQDEIANIAHQSMQHMFQMFMVDALVMPRLVSPGSWTKHITLNKLEPVIDRLMRREPMIMITGHCGNWELLGYFLSVMGFSVNAIARPLDNRYINKWLMDVRQARGLNIITKWGATPELLHALQTGGNLGFIADQNAGDQGLFVPFFGRLASSYKSIGLLALRHNVPIVAGHAKRVNGGFEYVLSCHDVIEPEEWADHPDPLFYITARYNRAIESMIRDAPEQYLWLHRRWKSRPKHEREGRPLPAKLADKLRTLPWMTEEDVERIANYRHPG